MRLIFFEIPPYYCIAVPRFRLTLVDFHSQHVSTELGQYRTEEYLTGL